MTLISLLSSLLHTSSHPSSIPHLPKYEHLSVCAHKTGKSKAHFPLPNRVYRLPLVVPLESLPPPLAQYDCGVHRPRPTPAKLCIRPAFDRRPLRLVALAPPLLGRPMHHSNPSASFPYHHYTLLVSTIGIAVIATLQQHLAHSYPTIRWRPSSPCSNKRSQFSASQPGHIASNSFLLTS